MRVFLGALALLLAPIVPAAAETPTRSEPLAEVDGTHLNSSEPSPKNSPLFQNS